jgi:hypothetical protein
VVLVLSPPSRPLVVLRFLAQFSLDMTEVVLLLVSVGLLLVMVGKAGVPVEEAEYMVVLPLLAPLLLVELLVVVGSLGERGDRGEESEGDNVEV